MLPILAILVLFVTALAMLAIHRWRPNFAYHWLVAAFGAIVSFSIMLMSGLRLPQTFELPATSLLFLTDHISWPLAAALSALNLAVILTAAAQMNRSNWLEWVGTLTVSGFGLTAVLAGTPVTLLAAWVALDIIELAVFLGQVVSSSQRTRIAAGFAARIVGVFIALWGISTSPSGWGQAIFSQPTDQTYLYLILAVGLRLGVLPLNMPFTGELTLHRGLGTALRLAPAAGNLVLLAKIVPQVPAPYTLLLVILTSGAALIGAWSWATLRGEVVGTSYWILGTSGLAVCASLLGKPEAAISWGLLCVLTGGLLALISRRHFTYLLTAVVLLSISSLPFTPNWAGADIYTIALDSTGTGLNRVTGILLAAIFMLVHALLLAGCIRHILEITGESSITERWVSVVYPFGLIVPVATHIAVSINLWPQANRVSLANFLAGVLVLVFTAVLWFASLKRPKLPVLAVEALRKIFILDWAYKLLWIIYQILGRVVSGITGILEGMGGVLWAFVLLALLFTLLQQRIPGG